MRQGRPTWNTHSVVERGGFRPLHLSLVPFTLYLFYPYNLLLLLVFFSSLYSLVLLFLDLTPFIFELDL